MRHTVLWEPVRESRQEEASASLTWRLCCSVPSDQHHPGARVHGCACAVCRVPSVLQRVVLNFHFCEGNRLGPLPHDFNLRRYFFLILLDLSRRSEYRSYTVSARALLPIGPVPRAAGLSAPCVKAVVGRLAETRSGRFPVPSSECRSEVPPARAAASWTAAPTGAWTLERGEQASPSLFPRWRWRLRPSSRQPAPPCRRPCRGSESVPTWSAERVGCARHRLRCLAGTAVPGT